MSREPVEPTTLSDAAFLRLRTDIMTGALKPGAKLKIGDLVARYDVGASPIREALARLSSDHLVVLRGQRGFSVAPISREELLDLVCVRQLVEAEAVALSIEHGDVDWEARIVAAYFRLQRAHRQSEAKAFAWSQSWEDCNRDFHDAVCSACGSVWLLRLQRQLYELSERYRRIAFDRPRLPRDGDAEHKAIMDACLARNSELARRLAVQHIERTATMIAEIMPHGGLARQDTRSRILQVLNGGAEMLGRQPPAARAGPGRKAKSSAPARRARGRSKIPAG